MTMETVIVGVDDQFLDDLILGDLRGGQLVPDSVAQGIRILDDLAHHGFDGIQFWSVIRLVFEPGTGECRGR